MSDTPATDDADAQSTEPDDDPSLYGDDQRAVETIEDANHIPDEDFADPDSESWTLGQTRVGAVRINDELFKLEEPEEDDDVASLIAGTSDGRLLFDRTIEVLVTTPDVSPDVLREKMTAKERLLLAEKALDWFGMEEFVDQEEVQRILDERFEQEAEQAETAR